jgi:hypothetical protein
LPFLSVGPEPAIIMANVGLSIEVGFSKVPSTNVFIEISSLEKFISCAIPERKHRRKK